MHIHNLLCECVFFLPVLPLLVLNSFLLHLWQTRITFEKKYLHLFFFQDFKSFAVDLLDSALFLSNEWSREPAARTFGFLLRMYAYTRIGNQICDTYDNDVVDWSLKQHQQCHRFHWISQTPQKFRIVDNEGEQTNVHFDDEVGA